MMDIEKRKHPRFNPSNLNARIVITPVASLKVINLTGSIVDMSYTGIKIRLDTPINKEISGSEIEINFTIPESGIPVSIHGVIKHLNNEIECGLQLSDQHSEQELDEMMFECIKISKNNIQRIITPQF